VTLSRGPVFALALVVSATCYLNALPNQFVLDDRPIVETNPTVRTVDWVGALRSGYWGNNTHEGIYRPATIFSLSIDYALWKLWPPGYHLTNLVLHAVSGFLLFLLCASLVGAGPVPLFAMLIFLVHPAHSEAVTAAIGRAELLSAAFFLGAWLLFRRGQLLGATVVFFLALLSKENTIVLPGVLLLDRWLSREPRSKTFRDVAIVSAAALAYLALRFAVLGELGIPAAAQYMSGQLSYGARVMTSGRVFLEYLRLTFFPLRLAGDYDYNSIPIADVSSWDAWLGLLLAALSLGAGFVLWRRRPPAGLGILLAFAALAPVSGLFLPLGVLLAERFLYLPLLGLSLSAAVLIGALPQSRPLRIAGAAALFVAVLLCNSHDYSRRNNFAFFSNMARSQPNNVKARLGYALALLEVGKKDEAVTELEAGLKIWPDAPQVLSALAGALMTETDCTAAWPYLLRALKADRFDPNTHWRMGDCAFREGKFAEAEGYYSEAVHLLPYPNPNLFTMWGKSLEALGRADAAHDAYQRAAELK
jgi:tetratricopeptide (TPR) repeat protein